jgi:ribosomal protein S5
MAPDSGESLMRFKDLDAAVKGWRSIDLYVCHDGGIGVCVANHGFGKAKTVKTALKRAIKEARRKKSV